jgi:hypothetical protein
MRLTRTADLRKLERGCARVGTSPRIRRGPVRPPTFLSVEKSLRVNVPGCRCLSPRDRSARQPVGAERWGHAGVNMLATSS